MDYNLIEPYRDILIRKKIEEYKQRIDNINRMPNEDVYQSYGYSKQERIDVLTNKMNNLYNEFNRNTPIQYLGLTKIDILSYLRNEAYSLRLQAINFSKNCLIVWSSLREAVKIANILKELEPQLQFYSLHWLINNTNITIK